MVHKIIRRAGIAFAAWLPFFVLWVLLGLALSRERFSVIFIASLITMGSAGLLGIPVWYLCRRWPLPLGFTLSFYLLHILFALMYATVWTVMIYGIEAARLDAIRARLNPHFLFNALHTLAALVKFRPNLAEGAIERLGDMLRYTLKEDGRELVEFSEEFDFTREYLAFEQLRFEDRLKVDMQIDPESFNFELPAFSIQA